MNILITLPKYLLDKIISGEKIYEMLKCMPNNFNLGEDGFFVVEKGTDQVKCWCRVDSAITISINRLLSHRFSDDLCLSSEFILNYARECNHVCLLEIGKVVELVNVCRDSLHVDRNPLQFAYCPLSYGESF